MTFKIAEENISTISTTVDYVYVYVSVLDFSSGKFVSKAVIVPRQVNTMEKNYD